MAVTKDQIIKALSTVNDPDLKKDLVTLGMIENLEVNGNEISFDVVLTTPACPLKEKIKNDCQQAVLLVAGPDAVLNINMTSNVTSIRQNEDILPQVRNIIAVSSGKGGVGKSTVTSNLALALHKQGAKVGLIDADIYGPSIPTMFGARFDRPEVIQKDGKNRIIPIEKYGIKLLSIGFLIDEDNPTVWRGPMASSALRQFFADAEWGELDYLLIDLPPGTSDIHLTMVQTVPVTGALAVTTPQDVAMADVVKSVQMFRQPQINVPILGIVENMSWFTPAELPDLKYFIFGEGGGQALADRFDLPLLGQIPLVQGVREGGDRGRPIVLDQKSPAAAYFDPLASKTAQQVAIRNAKGDKTKIVKIKHM